MRNLVLGATVALGFLFTACSNTDHELVGSWKRSQLLDPGDEPTDDGKEGYILDLNEDKSFNLRFTYRDRRPFGGSRDRNKKGTWALAAPIVKDDRAALVLRFDEGAAIKEESHRVRTVSPDQMRLIYLEQTHVFNRR
jgi:hypothetical protein